MMKEKEVGSFSEKTLRIAYETIIRDGHQACFGIELCSFLNLTVEEIEDQTKENKEIARLVNLYKQKCQASQIAQLKKDMKSLTTLYTIEHNRLSFEEDIHE